jgi:hypothetical protein
MGVRVARTRPTNTSYLTDEFLDRVRRSYLLYVDRATISADSIWSQIATHNRPVHEALLSDDLETLLAFSQAPSHQTCSSGRQPR